MYYSIFSSIYQYHIQQINVFVIYYIPRCIHTTILYTIRVYCSFVERENCCCSRFDVGWVVNMDKKLYQQRRYLYSFDRLKWVCQAEREQREYMRIFMLNIYLNWVVVVWCECAFCTYKLCVFPFIFVCVYVCVWECDRWKSELHAF